MSLQPYSIAVGRLETGENGENYESNQAVYILTESDTLHPIFSDSKGLNPISQDGVNNVTNNSGEFSFFCESGRIKARINGNERFLGFRSNSSFVINDDGTSSEYAYELTKENQQNIKLLQGSQNSGVFGYATKSDLESDLMPEDNTIAYVTNDSLAENNGTYRKAGGVGGGSWVQSSSDLSSQAFQKSTQNESDISYISSTLTSNNPAGTLQEQLVSYTDGSASVIGGDLLFSKGNEQNPVISFDKELITQISFSIDLNASYLSIGNIGKSSVFFGVAGGAYGRFQLSDGDGNFTNLTGDVSISPIVGADNKAILSGTNLSLYQRALNSTGDYLKVLDYDLSLLSRPELDVGNRGFGFVNQGQTLSIKNVTYGNSEKLPVVTGNFDLSNSKDAINVSSATSIKSNVDYLISNSKGHKLRFSDINLTGDPSVSVNSDGDVNLQINSTAYPTIEVDSTLSQVSYKRGTAIYVLLSTSNDMSNVTILSISGGGAGNIFNFSNGGTFSLIGAAAGYDGAVPTDFIRQTITDDGVIIEGSSDGALYAELINYDFSLQGSLLDKKSLGVVASSSGDLILDAFVGNKDNGVSSDGGNWQGKKWACFGDSITEQARYVSSLSSILDVSSVQNLGVSGKTITPVDSQSVSEQWKGITGNPELITCFGGTNDFGTSKVIGSINDAPNSASFYGGLKYIAEGVISSHPLSRFFFINILHRDWQGGGQSSGLVNSNGDSVDDYNNAINEVARLYSIPVIDVYQNTGISLNTIDAFTYDRLHLNDTGGDRVANYINSVIKDMNDSY